MGQDKESIVDEAEEFFLGVMPSDQCPPWMNMQDWEQFKIIRDQWI